MNGEHKTVCVQQNYGQETNTAIKYVHSDYL
jgi:hypothetical protein